MKIHVRTHLRRKKHGKAIVRHHRRKIRIVRSKIDIKKKQPTIILYTRPGYPKLGRGLVVETPTHKEYKTGGIHTPANVQRLRKEAKRQFREDKEWNDQDAESEIPSFFESAEPVSIEYVFLKPPKKKLIVE